MTKFKSLEKEIKYQQSIVDATRDILKMLDSKAPAIEVYQALKKLDTFERDLIVELIAEDTGPWTLVLLTGIGLSDTEMNALGLSYDRE